MTTSPNCVWLVDDDEDDLMLMQAAFQNVAPDVQIRTLTHGDDVLPQLQVTPSSPNLIVLDLNMPHTGGLEVLVSLRSVLSYGQLPVVVLTTSSNPRDRLQSEKLGANEFYTKPSTFQDMSRLARLLIGQWLPALST